MSQACLLTISITASMLVSQQISISHVHFHRQSLAWTFGDSRLSGLGAEVPQRGPEWSRGKGSREQARSPPKDEAFCVLRTWIFEVK